MKFSLRNVSFVYPDRDGGVWADTRQQVQRAERDGLHGFWLMDHFSQLKFHGPAEEPFLDAWTTLPALAAATHRIRLGVMVSPVAYRNPAMLARMVSTMDHISGGRFDFGFGAGGYEPEYQAYGFEFIEPPSIRLEQMAEAVRLMKTMWAEPEANFSGQFFSVEDAVLEPKPLQQPHPPILIGGAGPKITLRMVAELGDACNLWGPPEKFAEQRTILEDHCRSVGRDESEIEKTVYELLLSAPNAVAVEHKIEKLLPKGKKDEWMGLVGTPQQLIETIEAYRAAGAEQLCFEIPGNDAESYQLLVDEVLPEVTGANQ